MKRALVALALAAAAPVGAPSQACAAGASAVGASAAVHIVDGTGNTSARCMSIEPGVTTGIEALRATGADITTEEFAGSGSLVCAIDGVGSDFPRAPCVPPCPNGRCRFWAYLTRTADGPWTFSSIGASTRTLRDGDADAWVFGSHTTTSVDAIPALDDAVCARGFTGGEPARTGAASFPLAGLVPFGVALVLGAGAWRRMRGRRA